MYIYNIYTHIYTHYQFCMPRFINNISKYRSRGKKLADSTDQS